MSVPEQAFWDIVIKATVGLATVVGGYFAIRKYLFERQHANETARTDSHAPFSKKRQEVYFELIGATALLGTRDPADPAWGAAALKFWELFWGAVPMVVDAEVARLVDAYSEILAPQADGVALRNASMELARACRRSLGEAWQVTLDVLPASPEPRNYVRGTPR